jgi:hypothetical protein
LPNANSFHRSTSASQADGEQGGPSLSQSIDSVDSDFLSWGDTGDLGDRLADADDPLGIRLTELVDQDVYRDSSGRETTNIRVPVGSEPYRQEGRLEHTELTREEITISNHRPRHVSEAEHILATTMVGNERQMHGLTGRPLVYGELYGPKLDLD